MPARRRIDPVVGASAVRAWLADHAVERSVKATAVRYALEELGARVPGRSVEVRVPPFGAVQCIEGPSHKRGTPPNVTEADADTWLALVTGEAAWDEVEASGALRVSGIRADLGDLLPLFPALD